MQQHSYSHNNNNKRPKYCYTFHINDHVDILIEILKKLDGRSLTVAASVCRLWCSLTRDDDSLWEHLCFRHLSSSSSSHSLSPSTSTVRPVVVALGGYKRLYMDCVRRVLSRLGESTDSVQLSLSLFCVDYYERFGDTGTGTGGDVASASSSLMFLCQPLNV